MQQENRRSFVKKSLATSVSISFSGLIRAHGEEGGGATTTWNPQESTFATTDSGGTTTWNPEETTTTTTEGTTTPREASIRKHDPNAEETPVYLKSSQFGTITVSENKGGEPAVFETRWQAKVFWVIESKLTVSKANKQNSQIIPVKTECFQCSATGTKISLKVEETDGVAAGLATSIENVLNEQLRINYNNNAPQTDKFIPCPDIINGVTGTAVETYQNHPEIETTYTGKRPNPAPQGQTLQMELDAKITPEVESDYKTIEWKFSFKSGPQLTVGIKDTMEGEVKTDVTKGHGSWQVTTFTLPPCEGFDDPDKPTQVGTAHMLYSVQPGAACNLP